MRYGLGVDKRGTGLRDIWGMTSVPAMAWLSMLVVAVFACAFTMLSIRVFTRSTVR
jgi:hypothetical protein